MYWYRLLVVASLLVWEWLEIVLCLISIGWFVSDLHGLVGLHPLVHSMAASAVVQSLSESRLTQLVQHDINTRDPSSSFPSASPFCFRLFPSLASHLPQFFSEPFPAHLLLLPFLPPSVLLETLQLPVFLSFFPLFFEGLFLYLI